MGTYVYCSRMSNGAKELVEALGASRLRNFDGLDFWRKKHKVKLVDGDVIVCWGDTLPELDEIKVLNGKSLAANKFKEAELLSAKLGAVKPWRKVPNGVAGEWLGRRNNHVGGSDLLHKVAVPDYYVMKDNFVNEYRIHSFAGFSMRAGKKVLREGWKLGGAWDPAKKVAHPWVRSFDGGWRIDYDGFQSKATMRKLSKQAVDALGLTFGAVDIGERADGTLIVLEVNRAPGIEGGSVEKYVEYITKWIENPNIKSDEELDLEKRARLQAKIDAKFADKKLAAMKAAAVPKKRAVGGGGDWYVD